MIPITIQNLSKHYGVGRAAVRAVDDVCLTIQAGELFFLLGPSGCGKTTLLRMIAGPDRADGGRVLFGERDVTRLPSSDANTAMVFQNYALWPHMTVQQNVEFGPRMRGLAARPAAASAPPRTSHRVQMDGLRRPQAQPAFRRPAAAGGPGPGAGGAAASACCWMSRCRNLDARLRLHMRGRTAPAGQGHRRHGRLRHARPEGGAVDGRPHRRDGRRADRAGRHAAGTLRAARPLGSSPTSWARRTS